MPIPTKGRTVTVVGIYSNGEDSHPAVITRSWGQPGRDTSLGPVAVNLTVFPDAAPPLLLSSVQLYETEQEARSHFGNRMGHHAAFWPARA